MATMSSPSANRRYISDRRAASNTTGMTNGMNAVDWIAMVILIVGGINWGLIGLTDFDMVTSVFGQGSVVSRFVYMLVGVCALYSILTTVKLADRQSPPDNRKA